MFEFNTTVKLHDTDSAGLLFYAHQFRITHDAYEMFLESIDCPMAWIIGEAPFYLPIVHADGDYTRSVAVGDRLKIELTVKSISVHSFVLDYRLLDSGGKMAGRVSTVHVSVDKGTGATIPLPQKLKLGLESKS